MASVGQLRTALATRMATISGLRVAATAPDNPQPPVAVVMPERVEYDLNARRGADRFYFTVTVLVGRADERNAQQRLDVLIVGPGSIKAAIEADRSLGGIADTARVVEMRNYSSVPVGDTLYLGAQFTVEVVA
jgi:hypothetical protein